MEDQRVIFLDVDGVLNSVNWYGKYYFRHRYGGDRITQSFDPKAIKRLNYIVAKTDARIVLSSVWRLGKSLNALRRMFYKVGGDFLLIGKTERYCHKEISLPRGSEIKEYYGRVFDYPSYSECWPNKLLGYLILDDDSDMLYEQRDHFLKTDKYYGLTDEDVPRAIDILMKNLPKKEK